MPVQISAHNNLVDMAASQGEDAAFHCWLQFTPQRDDIDVREFSTAVALFIDNPQLRSNEEILNMIHSRYHPAVPEDPSESATVMKTPARFDFEKLESDVVRYFIAGKPSIKGVEWTLRRPFRFRNTKAVSSTAGSG